jgi:hypothetical protein
MMVTGPEDANPAETAKSSLPSRLRSAAKASASEGVPFSGVATGVVENLPPPPPPKKKK